VSPSPDLAERFAALAPWRTRFEIDGSAYGGELDYADDQRVPTFFSWFGRPRTILELSSCEGGHTLRLAARTTGRVLGIEGREKNVKRAQLVAELLCRDGVEFVVDDLDTVDLARHGAFDAVFCAGVLHRLTTPWRLLREVSRVSSKLFLDTHYWAGSRITEVEGYRGAWVHGGDRETFWLTRPSLLRALTSAGWAVRQITDQPQERVGPRAWYCCVRPRDG
jgi:SAM-dependent methyltransferase